MRHLQNKILVVTLYFNGHNTISIFLEKLNVILLVALVEFLLKRTTLLLVFQN